VECDARSPVAEPSRCARAQVQRFPTWVIGDTRFEGVVSLEDLARASGFQPPK
jgi:hypothetical protein